MLPTPSCGPLPWLRTSAARPLLPTPTGSQFMPELGMGLRALCLLLCIPRGHSTSRRARGTQLRHRPEPPHRPAAPLGR
ncbi:hypothetical protein NDU88_004548 [Pleurodeles waltl]|uniref:Uncharacterized protein n=1 Tax=Pleurodeles waltl TaxID=8319 RepID=A0AAV7M7E7_PLEWA|nr:hypothetical protein NDU88_004548 [Pleurodeles waltl]